MPRYTDADLAALLMKQGHAVEFKFRKNPKAHDPNVPTESQIQQSVIKWWRHAHTGFGVPENMLMAFPLQAARTPRNGARMKAEGCRAGTLDLLLSVPRSGYSSLWIEMKTPKGIISDEQKNMIACLKAQDYCVSICRSLQEAIGSITSYLDDPNNH